MEVKYWRTVSDSSLQMSSAAMAVKRSEIAIDAMLDDAVFGFAVGIWLMGVSVFGVGFVDGVPAVWFCATKILGPSSEDAMLPIVPSWLLDEDDVALPDEEAVLVMSEEPEDWEPLMECDESEEPDRSWEFDESDAEVLGTGGLFDTAVADGGVKPLGSFPLTGPLGVAPGRPGEFVPVDGIAPVADVEVGGVVPADPPPLVGISEGETLGVALEPAVPLLVDPLVPVGLEFVEDEGDTAAAWGSFVDAEVSGATVGACPEPEDPTPIEGAGDVLVLGEVEPADQLGNDVEYGWLVGPAFWDPLSVGPGMVFGSLGLVDAVGGAVGAASPAGGVGEVAMLFE
jgi:hypothetical protein